MQLRLTGAYKNSSLLLKMIIVVVTLFYIYHKLLIKNDFGQLLDLIQQRGFNTYILLATLLMFINWLFEALKWRLLINPLEVITIQQSCKAVTAGIAISLFTPNRVGEFAGRVYYLKQADKIKATLLTFVGSAYQLFCTVVIGLTALGFWYANKHDFPWLKTAAKTNFPAFLIGVMLALFLVLIVKKKIKLPKQLINYLAIFSTLQVSTHIKILLLSFARYLTFSLQFYLLLKWLGVTIDLLQGLQLIPIMFFLIAAIPTFALSELGVRGATAIFVLGAVSSDTAGILTASLLLWVINLALPALAGLLFVFDLNFFKPGK